MTRDAISEELFAILNAEPAGKGGVLYGLIQIRKILEQDGSSDRYWALNFFCDWLVHAELTRAGALKILKILDDRLATFDARNPEGIDPDGMVMSILSLDLLRQDLRVFLQRSHLPTRWVDDDFSWQDFARFYAQQVHDTPLVLPEGKARLNYICGVEIVGFEPAPDFVKANPEQRYRGIEWLFTLNTGQKFVIAYTSNIMVKPPQWATQGVIVKKLSSVPDVITTRIGSNVPSRRIRRVHARARTGRTCPCVVPFVWRRPFD